jgi:putative SOS response-associated peptidase YedK
VCGRYDFQGVYEHGQDLELTRFFDVDLGELRPPPRFNVAPTQQVAAIRRTHEDARPRLVMLRWGLVPRWAKDLSFGARTINARVETAAEKPAFREAFRRRRCIVPATGFFEWEKTGAARRPWRFVVRGGEPFGIAGLWERWTGPEGPVETCALLTTEANERVRPLHDRMPLILPREAHAAWLDPDRTDPDELARTLHEASLPFPPEEMQAYPVSTRVNSPRNDDAECIRRSGDEP